MLILFSLIVISGIALAVPIPQFYGGYQPSYGGYGYPGGYGGIYPGGYNNYGEIFFYLCSIQRVFLKIILLPF